MGKIVVDMSICKGCGYCVQFCPAHAIRIGDKRLWESLRRTGGRSQVRRLCGLRHCVSGHGDHGIQGIRERTVLLWNRNESLF